MAETTATKPVESRVAPTEDVSDQSRSASVAGDLEGQNEKQKSPAAANPDEPAIEYPQGIKLWLILASLYLAIFLTALDRTIVATAIPQITNEFDSFTDIGWYGSAFLLTTCSFQLLFGRIYTFYSPKWTFITLIVIFEIGSVVCGAAPNSIAFIIGRAVAGLGASGMMGGAIIIMVYAAPLEKRPMYQGFVGAVFGVASIAGPLLGGLFTTKVTWRWCFYINLPIGAVTLLFLVLFLETPKPRQAGLTLKQQIHQLDPFGTLVFIPGIICILLALQWGGSKYTWSDGRIIAPIVLFGVLMIAFIGIQLWKKENGTVPPHIMKQRSIAAGSFYSLCAGAHMMIMIYYLPIWFQAIKGVSAIQSGIDTLPMLLASVVAAIANGILVSKVGYYVPSMIFSTILCSVATGIFTTFKVDTGSPMWIGIQVLYGLGLGSGMQQAGVAAQAVLSRKDIPTGVSVIMFAQSFGGTLSISIAQNVLDNTLISGLSHIPGFQPSSVVNNGATRLRDSLPAQYLQQVVEYYNTALTDVFYLAVAFSCLTVFGVAFMEWKSVKGR